MIPMVEVAYVRRICLFIVNGIFPKMYPFHPLSTARLVLHVEIHNVENLGERAGWISIESLMGNLLLERS